MRLSKVKLNEILPKGVKILGIRNMFAKDYEGWKELRKQGIGGSDIGALIGVNNYKTPIDVYLDKIGMSEDFDGNHKTEFGNWQEPVIASRFQKNHLGEYLLYDLDYTLKKGTLMANVDGVIYDIKNDRWGILEVKTTGQNSEKMWDVENSEKTKEGAYIFEVTSSPDSYYAQTQLYLEVTGFDFAILCGTIGQKYFESNPFERNAEEGKMINDMAEEFYNENVLKKEIPVCDGTENYTNFLKKKYPSDNGNVGTLDLDEAGTKMVTEYLEIKENIKEKEGQVKVMKKELEEKKQLLLTEMCDFNFAKSEAGTIKKSSNIRMLMDEEKLLSDLKEVKVRHPELFNNGVLQSNYKTRESLSERFAVSKIKIVKQKKIKGE